MKIQWKKLIICILIPLCVGIVSGLLSRGGMEGFSSLEQPPLSPPAILFPIVWTILYVLMGIASYLVLVSDMPYRSKTALTVYGIQLVFNFVWSLIFFNLAAYVAAFIWLLVLWVLIIISTILFYGINKAAGFLMLPYLLWVTFAAYLNLGVAILN